MLARDMDVKDVSEAARKAGRQVAQGGIASQELLEVISRELMDRETYTDMMNSYFEQTVAAGK
jgi:hypothetical protein